jgi:phenylacetate-CoA ligase
MSGREPIEARQLEQLRDLIALLLERNPFYRAKLAGAGAVRLPATLAEFSANTPFTTKGEIADDQLACPPYGTNLTFPLERYTRFCQTSATTGSPMRWLDTNESWGWMLDQWSRVFAAAGVTAHDHIFFAFSFGPFLGFWTAFESATRIGCLCIPGGGMRSAARLHAILDNSATVLCCTPTYALRLAEVAAEEGIDLGASKVRRIIVAGEPGGSVPGTQAEIERLWPGARVVDHHGMTEIGPVSYGCSVRRGVLHISEAGYIAEVIDPATGAAVGRGVRGELVLTNLGRKGSPLLRYRTSDVVQLAADERCECGSYELALEGGILGRTDDMVLVRGVNVYPSAVEDVLRTFGGIAEFRAEVRGNHGLAELCIQVEPVEAPPDPEALTRHIETALHGALGLRIPITLAAKGELPRFEMKAKRWVRL